MDLNFTLSVTFNIYVVSVSWPIQPLDVFFWVNGKKNLNSYFKLFNIIFCVEMPYLLFFCKGLSQLLGLVPLAGLLLLLLLRSVSQ